ncbi:MAG: DnaD domain protein [Clostridia bacterium]|nr:DnaD domain protein [Clostridia bacterium]
MYNINPNAYRSVFVLPKAIADDHLRAAGKSQLKLLLCLFSHPGEDLTVTEISRLTGVPKDEIDDDMLYWIDAGFITAEDSAKPHLNEQTAKSMPVIEATQQKPEPAAKEPDISYAKPTLSEIAKRTSESPEITALFEQLQKTLGKTLGYSIQSNVLMLIDFYGLPPEVVSILFSHAKVAGRADGISYIMSLGKRWARDGITTFELAEEEVKKLESSDRLWDEIKIRTGIKNPRPTTKQSEFLYRWTQQMGFDTDMILLAYEIMAEETGKISFSYMNTVLTRWHDANISTPDMVKAENENKTNTRKKAKRDTDAPPPSYDLDSIIQAAMDFDPTKTKRGEV